MRDRVCSILFAIAVFFLIITFSIGIPIYFRPFYYAHIDAMELDAKSRFTKSEIKEAYNDVLDYLTLPGRDFGAGKMKYSEEGMSHFADCKVLFNLNASVLVVSAITVIALLVFHKQGRIKRPTLLYCSAEFWSAAAAVVLPVALGGLASLNFDKAFTVFHKIFFPGKENWIFDPRTDEIIDVLPQQFFMNCAILIGIGVLVISLAIIAKEIIAWSKSNRKNGF